MKWKSRCMDLFCLVGVDRNFMLTWSTYLVPTAAQFYDAIKNMFGLTPRNVDIELTGDEDVSGEFDARANVPWYQKGLHV
jgi:hypothetical protein